MTKKCFDKVRGYVDQGVEEGARRVVDGRGRKVAGHEDGCFLRPLQTLAEATAMIDAHEHGNSTCIFTRDGEAARWFSDHIEVGTVGINVRLPVPVADHSFGGWKRSLFGDLHAYGPDAVRFCTRRKAITQRRPTAGLPEGAVFSLPSSR